MIANPQELRPSLESTVRQTGWAVTLRGVIAVIFGIVAIRSPNIAAQAFVIVFAVYAFADGILDFVLARQLARGEQRWGWYLVEGIASIALGVAALAFPGVTLLTAVLLIGLRAIVLGVLDLVTAFSWEGFDSRLLLGITGVLSIMLGILLLGSPAAGGRALLWTIGVYAMIFGLLLFSLGLRMLGAPRREERLHRHAAAAR